MPKTADPFKLTHGSSFSASGSAKGSKAKKPSSISKERVLLDFQSALDIIRANHVDGARLNSGNLNSAAISSMLKTLDPHSNYYDPTEFQDLLGEHESEYSGTGSSIAGYIKNGSLETYIVTTFPDSPAAKAGLRYGDRIVAVDGQNVSGKTPDAVRDKVRGKRGTYVRLTIERADSKAIEIVELQRDRVHEPAVSGGYLVKPGVGYIDLTAGFSYSTMSELEAALKDLNRQGMTSLILDIRGNGGGILDQAVKVAEKFLQAGSKIVSQRGRYPGDTRTWTAAKPRHETMPLVLLVDENSASASEVLAGAFQDNDRALIIGEKTFGKGLVQSVLSLPFGSGLTLTAARYYTPSGRSIQRDYSDVGLYDYFNHRNTTAEIERSAYVARTVTNRVVYGGDGITPDEIAAEDKLTAAQISLLDPLFFFTRELINGRVDNLQTSGVTANQQIRQQVVFGESTVSDTMIDEFAEFVAKERSWKISPSTITRERPYIKKMLRYNLAMVAFGIEGANRTRIENDVEVRQAIEAMPKAARLATAAQKARTNRTKEKGSLSLVLNEQR
ncbi:MAG: S41 family peptidase [Pyrinomonadaceae bacterium]